MRKIERALISVFDKRGVVEFGRALAGLGIEILSTGTTAQHLHSGSVAVRTVSDFTGFPEILEGRVKTLHPRVHGGILAIREDSGHRAQLSENGIETIDLVAVNLYPFGQTTRRPGVSFQEVIENIDIGGPTLIRAAAKNFQDVAVVTNPDDYPVLIEEITEGGLSLPASRLFRLAQQAFRHTAEYDQEIARYLTRITTRSDGFELPSEPD
jgi:phosphoribosylaminoimidazolecarboxamide formyltransferase/IMP cyclohydrolase